MLSGLVSYNSLAVFLRLFSRCSLQLFGGKSVLANGFLSQGVVCAHTIVFKLVAIPWAHAAQATEIFVRIEGPKHKREGSFERKEEHSNLRYLTSSGDRSPAKQTFVHDFVAFG